MAAGARAWLVVCAFVLIASPLGGCAGEPGGSEDWDGATGGQPWLDARQDAAADGAAGDGVPAGDAVPAGDDAARADTADGLVPGRPLLLFQPDPVDFGDVEGQAAVAREVHLQNVGALAARVTALGLVDTSSADFRLTEVPGLPLAVAPGDGAAFRVTYAPQGGGPDVGLIVVAYEGPDGAPFEGRVRVLGSAAAPDIVVSPAVVDFGGVALETVHRKPVAVTNEGSLPLVVEPPHFDAAHPALSLEDVPAAAVSLEPGESAGFTVAFAPSEPFPFTLEPLARIVVASNDPDEDPYLVPVRGNVDKPELRVTPADVVDFGVVAQDFTAERTLTIVNAGQLPLEVSALRLVDSAGALADEFAVEEDADFPPTQADGGGGVVPPNEARTVTLTFTNRGADSGEAWARLTVGSNDPTAGEVTVDLRARRGGEPECAVVLEPESYDFGTVPRGAYRDATLRVRNVGSGNCGFNRASISGCSAVLPGFPSVCTLGSSSAEFSVVGTPIPTPDGIPPGGTADVRVRYEPPAQVPLFGFGDYSAFLQVTIHDPYGPGGNASLFEVPPDPAAGSPEPNLVGRSGVSGVSVLPERVDFGLVTLGCGSRTEAVTVYSSGSAPLSVTEIELDAGCPSDFVVEVPPIPADGIEVTAESPLVIEVRYVAHTLGEQRCSLLIHSNDATAPVLSVPLTGAGTLDSGQVDVFRQVAGQEVDVLFVVDDSGSMCEEQDRLRANLQEFVSHAQAWGNGYRMGVVSTCVQSEDVCRGAGELQSAFYEAPDWERWVDNTTWPHFTANVDLGCDGGSDAQEAGLEAARRALSLPLSALTDQECAGDAGCQAPDTCIPGLGLCGGFNGGFLRDDAALEIVALSDEEDQSPGTTAFYVDFFRQIRGFANESFFHFHSIVGDAEVGCGDLSGSGTTAEAGDRYIEVSQATGGVVASICDDSFAAALSDIGAIAFGLKVQFFLSRACDPATLTVHVNGAPCPQGWLYDPASNSVIFEEDGPCLPQEGDELRVAYDSLCFTD